MTALFPFFLKNWLRSNKLFWTAGLGLFPVLLTVLLQFASPILEDHDILLYRLYPQISFFVYLHLLLPILAVMTGVSIINEEVEDETLPYLLVRPVPKVQIVLAKSAVYFTVTGVILALSLILAFSVLNLEYGFEGWLDESGKLLKGLGVLLLGLLAYLAFFGALGAWLRKPVLTGLLFAFGWENLVAYFPGNVKYLTIVHYLHSLFPAFYRTRAEGLLGLIPIKFSLAGGWTSFFMLLLLSAAFLALTCLALYVKEYKMDQT